MASRWCLRLSEHLQRLGRLPHRKQCVSPHLGRQTGAHAIEFVPKLLDAAGVDEGQHLAVRRGTRGGIQPLRLFVRLHRLVGQANMVVNLPQFDVRVCQVWIDRDGTP